MRGLPCFDSLLQRLAELASPDTYLVGGAVRDLVRGAPPSDNVDVATAADPEHLASTFAGALGGRAVLVGEAWQAYRVVLDGGGPAVDVVPLRARAIEADLARRDFTMNAMAVPLTMTALEAWERHLIDPCEGRDDARLGRLRVVQPQAFVEDSVRIFRGARLSAALPAEVDAGTQVAMRGAAARLTRAAAERVRDELFKLLATPRASAGLLLLDDVGALEVVIPEIGACRGVDQGGHHHLDVWRHMLETVRQLERSLAEQDYSQALRPALDAYLDESVAASRSRLALLKLDALLHDLGKPACRRVDSDGRLWFTGHEHCGAELAVQIAARLKLSRCEQAALERLVTAHLRPGHLARDPRITQRAIHRFFRDTGREGPGALLVWMADRLASRGRGERREEIALQRGVVIQLLDLYFHCPDPVVAPPKLLDGHQVMATLGWPPGPRVGEALAALREAQAIGEVSTAEEALVWLAAWQQGVGSGNTEGCG